jgi:preprotein translocase subunit SecA
LYRDIGFDEIHHIENAIKAQSVYRRDQEYIVADGQVVIIDTNTGRAMPGRRFNQ